MTDHLDILRLLVQQHDAKQFLTSQQQYAWFMAYRAVAEADAAEEKAA